tara:strand:+ start:4465 stop:5283 length:819 start_codon:yes stop_codon:yes gene_type:complete
MEISIEDLYEDVLAKSARGLGLSAGQLAESTGLEKEEIRGALRGEFVEEQARKLAPVLNLDADALVLLGEKYWRPLPVDIPGLACFNTPFEDMEVNAFLLWDPATKDAAIFDSGADASGMIEFIRSKALKAHGVWVTHTHRDHIEDLQAIVKAFDCPIHVAEKEMANFGNAFSAGTSFHLGGLHIETRLTWGHAMGGTTFVATGLQRPVAIVGDALFAQSMGGGMVSYKDALSTTFSEIFSLPEDTIICPGHGPMTSVAEEKKVNPFFAANF